jgi:hypothetical protein
MIPPPKSQSSAYPKSAPSAPTRWISGPPSTAPRQATSL